MLKIHSQQSKFLTQVPEIRRESVIMLGSLLTIKSGLSKVSLTLFEGLKKLLFEKDVLIKFQIYLGRPVDIVFAES